MYHPGDVIDINENYLLTGVCWNTGHIDAGFHLPQEVGDDVKTITLQFKNDIRFDVYDGNQEIVIRALEDIQNKFKYRAYNCIVFEFTSCTKKLDTIGLKSVDVIAIKNVSLVFA